MKATFSEIRKPFDQCAILFQITTKNVKPDPSIKSEQNAKKIRNAVSSLCDRETADLQKINLRSYTEKQTLSIFQQVCSEILKR